jgi:TPR repeat protein
MYCLGLEYEWKVKNYKKAREWYEKGAAKGNHLSMQHLAYMYSSGRGVAEDSDKAQMWFEEAAAHGNSSAISSLGQLYTEKGDRAKALVWYEKVRSVAANGDPAAMDTLGDFYAGGWGVPQDYRKAREWYEKAFAKGGKYAANKIADLYDNGHGVPKDANKAREWRLRS